MSKTTIKDPRVRIQPTYKLLKLVEKYKDDITEMPENIEKVMKQNGFKILPKVQILNENNKGKSTKIDVKLLENLKRISNLEEDLSPYAEFELIDSWKEKTTSILGDLFISDLSWLKDFLRKLRKKRGLDVYLHSFIGPLKLPENETLERNPELEARCLKLREAQENLDYRKMTKNVDATLKNYPEDTIAYQMKSMNSQIIAVLQFVFSVAAGFVFGFLGIELIVGNLDFGFRLLLGIIIALIIALAEIYFLAKKLNEYDDITLVSHPLTKVNKLHTD